MKRNKAYNVDSKVIYDGRYACVCALILAEEKDGIYVLANKRGPGCPTEVGKWNLICGYMDAGSAEDNVRREVLEETGVVLDPKDKIAFCGLSDTGKERNVTLRYLTVLEERKPISSVSELQGGEKDEVSEIAWINIKDLNTIEWAFNHNELIKSIITCLINTVNSYETVRNNRES